MRRMHSSSSRVPSSSSSSSSTTSTSSPLWLSSSSSKSTSEADKIVTKHGLELGLFKAFKSRNTRTAKELLRKYGKGKCSLHDVIIPHIMYISSSHFRYTVGIAYLITSISLAGCSFYICYALISNGVDVRALLGKIGLKVSTQNQSNAGTVALAYICHKAASPIRFPPTVALTPMVANMLGGRKTKEEMYVKEIVN